MLRVGVETTLIKSPKVDVAVDPNPTTVPTPTDSCGLKYTLSSIDESNTLVLSGILKKLGMRETGVETVWIPPDTPLLTLNILFWLNVFKTDNTSVPIPIVLPTEICSGIVVTYMSVVMPVVATFGTCWYIIVCAVLIPILCDPASPLIDVVLKPDITTLSWAFKLGAVPIYAATWVGSLQTCESQNASCLSCDGVLT